MSSKPPSRKHRQRRPCPQCQHGLRRTRRGTWDHVVSLLRPRTRRYRCVAPACGWEGLIDRGLGAASAVVRADALAAASAASDEGTPAAAAVAPMMKRQIFMGMAAAAALAGAAVAASAVYQFLNPPEEAVRVGPRKVVRGISHDGDKLPTNHPLLVATAAGSPVGETDEVEPPQPPLMRPPAAASSAGAAASREGLNLRRHCSWGVPGRNPYAGSVEQALRTARVPESVVRRIAEDVAAKRVTDRLSISNGSIRADGSGRRFDPNQVAMTYGRTLCVDTRVNFKKNHVERADLYEAADSKGNMVAVMVPDVCGNVSVLSEVAEADDLQGAEAARQEGGSSGLRRLPQALVYNDGGAGGVGARQAASRSASNNVPTPGTLLCSVTALAAALWLTRRRQRR